MQIAGRYETLELLGSGGMGEVYLALDQTSGQQVALKLLRDNVSADIVTRFDRECALLTRMTHPAVVRVLDRGASEGRVFYTMEHIAWPTLSQRMADRFREGRAFDLTEALRILEVLAGALDHLHSLDVVHRDLKPSNLLVSDDLQVRVIDFGLAGMLTERMTRTGAVLGSMLYLSPEQVRADKSLDTRSDIFQVGLILYELLAGRKAYTNVVDYVRKLRSGEPPFPSPAEVEPKISKPVSDAVMRALAVDPDDRPSSAGELYVELAAAAAGAAVRMPSRASRKVARAAPAPARPTRPAPVVTPPPAGRGPLVPIAVTLALLLAAGAGSWFANGRRATAQVSGLEVTHGFFRTEMRWSTAAPAPAAVVFSREGESDLRRESSGQRTHVVTLTELEPSATYRAQVLVDGEPASSPVMVNAPARPSIDQVSASPAPDGTRVAFRTPVAASVGATWKGVGGETGSTAPEPEALEQHSLLLTGFRPRGPFALELRCVSRLGETWTTRVQKVEAK